MTDRRKVRIQYRNMPTAFIGGAVICSLMGVVLLSGAGLEKTIGWMSVVYMRVIARYIRGHRQHPQVG